MAKNLRTWKTTRWFSLVCFWALSFLGFFFLYYLSICCFCLIKPTLGAKESRQPGGPNNSLLSLVKGPEKEQHSKTESFSPRTALLQLPKTAEKKKQNCGPTPTLASKGGMEARCLPLQGCNRAPQYHFYQCQLHNLKNLPIP